MFKRIMSLFLSIVMVLSMLPVQAFAGSLASEETIPLTESAAETTAGTETAQASQSNSWETTAPAEVETTPNVTVSAEPEEPETASVTAPEESEPAVTEPAKAAAELGSGTCGEAVTWARTAPW